MKNENIVIFGDSYSTFAGYIPEGYAVYYPREGEYTVTDVDKTWWHMLAQETASHILLNNSWSGSTVCNTGYGGDCSQTSSFIHRLEVLTEEGFFEQHTPDRVFVFGGTNDSWSGNACGEVKYADWTREDLLRVLPGYSYFIHLLCKVVPCERVHAVINSGIRDEIVKGIAEICTHYGISCTYLHDIDKENGHPTYTGMTQIKNQILTDIG